MKKILITGTGAVAAELTSYIEDNNKFMSEDQKTEVVGYIDYEYNIEKYWRKYNFDKPVIGDIDSYNPKENEEILIGISDIKFRNYVIAELLKKNAKITSFIHNSVILPGSCKLGIGNIVYPFCIIGPNTVIGDFNMLTSYSFISHDCIVGNGNIFSTSGLAGRVKVGDNNFFGIRATVIPSITIGTGNIIQAGMVVDRDIDDGTTIFYRHKEKILAIPKT